MQNVRKRLIFGGEKYGIIKGNIDRENVRKWKKKQKTRSERSRERNWIEWYRSDSSKKIKRGKWRKIYKITKRFKRSEGLKRSKGLKRSERRKAIERSKAKERG